MAQLILVDNTDGGITYDGPWSVARNTLLDIGNFGPPFQQTLHGVSANASLTYTFIGTQVSVMGTSIVSTSGGPVDPSWECFVDGTSIGAKDPIFFSENNWPLCESGTLSSGSHTLRLVATVRRGNTFWFDRIQYAPTPGASFAGRTVYIDDTDPRVSFGDGWQTLRDIAHETQTDGAEVTISFSGTSLTWYGFIPGDFPSPSAEATYSIDDGPETTFFLQGLEPGAMELYNQVFFQTPSLASGDHTIRVTHRGNSGQTPLTLDYIVITGGGITAPPSGGSGSSSSSSSTSMSTSSSSASTQSSSVTPSAGGGTQIPSGVPSSLVQPANTDIALPSPSNDTSSQQAPTPVGAIAGGAVAGLALIVFLILGILFLRRRKRDTPVVPTLETSETPHPRLDPYTHLRGSSSNLQPVRYTALESQPEMTLSPVTPPSTKAQLYANYPANHTPSTNPSTPPSNYSVPGSNAGSPLDYNNPGSSAATLQPTLSALAPPSNHSGSGSSSGSLVNPSPYGGVTSSKDALLAESRPVRRDVVAENVPNVSPSSDQAQRVVRHQDSGYRMRPQTVELPPEYTPG